MPFHRTSRTAYTQPPPPKRKKSSYYERGFLFLKMASALSVSISRTRFSVRSRTHHPPSAIFPHAPAAPGAWRCGRQEQGRRGHVAVTCMHHFYAHASDRIMLRVARTGASPLRRRPEEMQPNTPHPTPSPKPEGSMGQKTNKKSEKEEVSEAANLHARAQPSSHQPIAAAAAAANPWAALHARQQAAKRSSPLHQRKKPPKNPPKKKDAGATHASQTVNLTTSRARTNPLARGRRQKYIRPSRSTSSRMDDF